VWGGLAELKANGGRHLLRTHALGSRRRRANDCQKWSEQEGTEAWAASGYVHPHHGRPTPHGRQDLNQDRIYGHVKLKKDRTTFLEFCRYLRTLYPSWFPMVDRVWWGCRYLVAALHIPMPAIRTAWGC